MSGGVDSSVAAALLKKRGYEVTGVHLKCFSARGGSPPSPSFGRAGAFGGNVDGCAAADAEDARRAAETLGIPLYVFDFEESYKEKVVKYMVQGYRRGITPNPDVMCNKEIKFGLFYRKARAMGADYVATGHYARLRRKARNSKHEIQKNPFRHSERSEESAFELFVAKDSNKDQSYFLWTLTQDILRHCLFPIGDYTKPRVRSLARRFNLPNAEKKDSQGICFLGQVALDDFLADYIPRRKGALVDVAGRMLGEHFGAAFYTIGQRRLGIKNLELGSKGGGEVKPYYVAEKNVRANTVVLAPEGHPSLYKREISLSNVNFISSVIHNSSFIIPVMARVRYRQPLVKAHIEFDAADCSTSLTTSPTDKTDKTYRTNNQKRTTLIFEKPQKFIAPGQSAVFYSGRGILLGGGVIVSAR